MTSQSFVRIDLSYKGDPYKFWEILKIMKVAAERNGVVFDCGQITTITHEAE